MHKINKKCFMLFLLCVLFSIAFINNNSHAAGYTDNIITTDKIYSFKGT